MPIEIKPELEFTSLDSVIRNLKSHAAVRKVALQAEQVFVDESPVDTGVLRANWFVSTDPSDRQVDTDKTTHTPSNPPDNQPTLTVINNVQYAVFANFTAITKPRYLEKALAVIFKFVGTTDLVGVLES